MLSPNMSLEVLYPFLLKHSDELFERPEKLFIMMTNVFFVYPIYPFSNMLQIVGVDCFIERTLLYKMGHSTGL
jgi:hypothetical protein